MRTKLTYSFHMEREVFVDLGKGGFGSLKESEMLEQKTEIN